jgi:hypothetical protein
MTAGAYVHWLEGACVWVCAGYGVGRGGVEPGGIMVGLVGGWVGMEGSL